MSMTAWSLEDDSSDQTLADGSERFPGKYIDCYRSRTLFLAAFGIVGEIENHYKNKQKRGKRNDE